MEEASNGGPILVIPTSRRQRWGALLGHARVLIWTSECTGGVSLLTVRPTSHLLFIVQCGPVAGMTRNTFLLALRHRHLCSGYTLWTSLRFMLRFSLRAILQWLEARALGCAAARLVFVWGGRKIRTLKLDICSRQGKGGYCLEERKFLEVGLRGVLGHDF